jgi:uncharacterized protein YndB with AHSA1/START domain
MIKFTETIEIAEPVDKVFSFISNLENTPRWNDDIVKTKKMSPGPIQEGTVFRQYRDGPGGAGEVVAIRLHAPPERLELQARLADSPAQVTYELDALDGGTQITTEIELEPKGVMKLIAPVVESRVRDSVAEDLAELKRAIVRAMGAHEASEPIRLGLPPI